MLGLKGNYFFEHCIRWLPGSRADWQARVWHHFLYVYRVFDHLYFHRIMHALCVNCPLQRYDDIALCPMERCMTQQSKSNGPLQTKCLSDCWTMSELPIPQMVPVSELGQLHPTIFVTFQNDQYNIHTHFTKLLAIGQPCRFDKVGRSRTSQTFPPFSSHFL